MSFIEELKRRNVFKVGIAYAVTTWILMQLVDVVSEILVLPVWAPKLILLMLVVGFIPALILAWAFELTPEGIKLEKDVSRTQSITPKTGRKLDLTIIALLGLALAYFIWESRFEQKIAEFEASTAEVSNEEAVTEAPVAESGEASVEVDENSIAVLPFANRSADVGDVYFTDGIHDDLLTQLSKIDALSVISRTSVMEYRDTTKNLREIAQELRVANVMEGSVQRAGDRVRINVQLIDANSDEHLWAETYDRELTTANLFDIQSEIAQAIADALRATLTDSELARVADVPTDNVAAYDLYLQARRFELGDTRVNSQTALELYKEALLLDPEFHLAWIGLASSHMSNYWNYGGDPADRELARKAIDRAKSINADFGELYMAEGFYWYWGHLDYERALYNIEKAIEVMPGNDDAYMWRGYISRRMGLWDQALDSMGEALKLNPRIAFNWTEIGWTYQYLHRYDEARARYQQALVIDPDIFWAKSNMALLEIQESGNVKAAVKLTIGAQHSAEFDHIETFMVTRTLDRRFDEVLEVARNLPDQMEIQRSLVMLREMWSARILYYMGLEDEAGAAAEAAQFRLQGLRVKLGDDHRIDLADAQIGALKGADPETVRNLVQKSMASRPEDKVAEVGFKLDFARIFAMAGMTDEAIELLEPLFAPPSESSVHTIGLDPAFDGIREDPEFVAMMERQR
jgi:TolB-like protein